MHELAGLTAVPSSQIQSGQLGLELLPFGKGLFSIAPPYTLKRKKYEKISSSVIVALLCYQPSLSRTCMVDSACTWIVLVLALLQRTKSPSQVSEKNHRGWQCMTLDDPGYVGRVMIWLHVGSDRTMPDAATAGWASNCERTVPASAPPQPNFNMHSKNNCQRTSMNKNIRNAFKDSKYKETAVWEINLRGPLAGEIAGSMLDEW